MRLEFDSEVEIRQHIVLKYYSKTTRKTNSIKNTIGHTNHKITDLHLRYPQKRKNIPIGKETIQIKRKQQ